MMTSSERTTLTDGSPVPRDGSHLTPKPSGQQSDYVVLSQEERARGLIEPVRDAYVHVRCGTLTTMGRALAETYAAQPSFYSGTFCCGCGAHFPVGANGEFFWDKTNQRVGTRRDPLTHLEPFDVSYWIAQGMPDLEIQPGLPTNADGSSPVPNTYNRDLLYRPTKRP